MTTDQTTHVVTDIHGTLDEMEPRLRDEHGITHARTMAGPQPLSTFDPYGMRRIGSVNIQSERWAHHIYRGVLVFIDGRPYLADANPDGTVRHATPPLVNGLFPLMQGEAARS